MSAALDTLRLTAEEAIGLLERREASPAELHAAYRDAIAARDPELHCFLRTVDFETGSTGIPIALKDVISTRGVETTAGSRILEGYVPVFDSSVAARVRAAIRELGVGEAARVDLKLADRRAVSGHVVEARDEAFSVAACAPARPSARSSDAPGPARRGAAAPRSVGAPPPSCG